MEQALSLMAIKGSSSLPEAFTVRDRATIVDALDDAILLVSSNRAVSWDGPDHPSLSWELELENWVEVGVFEHASILQFSIDVVAPMETGLSRSVIGVRDERLARGWLKTRTAEETRDVVLSLLREWRAICADGHLVDNDRSRPRDLPPCMREAGEAVISRFGALAASHGMADALDAEGVELMWHLRNPTAHTRATLCASASGNEEATFDDRTMDAVFEGLPSATWAMRDANDPIALTIAPYEWRVDYLEPQDTMTVLRELGAMGIDWNPELVVRKENA